MNPSPIAPIAAVVKPTSKKTIVFDCNFDLVFDRFGVHEIPSGTSGYHPEEVSVVMRNVCTDGSTTATKEADDEIRAAAEISEAALLAEIARHYRANGRATSTWNHVMGNDEGDYF